MYYIASWVYLSKIINIYPIDAYYSTIIKIYLKGIGAVIILLN